MLNVSTTCSTCKVLQEALEFERERNKELLETVMSIIKPAPLVEEHRVTPSAVPRQVGLTFTRRRAELEKQDKLRTEALNSPHAAKPDSELASTQKTVSQLEAELGVVDSEKKEG